MAADAPRHDRLLNSLWRDTPLFAIRAIAFGRTESLNA
jgi:hypothetical protein